MNYSTKNTPETKRLVGWQKKLGLSQHIKAFTRASEASRSMIDLILTMDNCSSAGF